MRHSDLMWLLILAVVTGSTITMAKYCDVVERERMEREK
jgi:hypothetical protein